MADDTSTFGQTWGPFLGQAAGIGGGILASRWAQGNAMQRSPEETAALTGAQGAAGVAGQGGASLLNQSMPLINQPASYYRTLLQGNRAQMANVTAPARASLNDQYGGAARQITGSGVRGAGRDVLLANLARDRAAKVAGLTTGVQPAAAGALASLGQGLQQTAVPLLNSSGNIFQQLLGQGAYNRFLAMQEGEKTAKPIGSLLADLGTSFGKNVGTKPPTRGQIDPNTGLPVNSQNSAYNPNPQGSDYYDPGYPTAASTGGYQYPDPLTGVYPE